MEVLKGLEPEKVFYYFEEICNIPHGSGNTKKISDYLADFAKKRGLTFYQDALGNVIIIKEATKGYENSAPVMLQGHMDMVAVKKPDYDIDMAKEGLRLKISGDKIYAEGTSLGGDDGIAVAYGLALLDDDTCRHPRIELVITVDEEVGMDGARGIDLSCCKATTLINLDSEEEGMFLAGCAGGAGVNFNFDYKEEEGEGIPCKIKVSGLLGGHSGAEIHKERGNANVLLTRILYQLSGQSDFRIISLRGGLADNAIPREAQAEILLTGYADETVCEKQVQEIIDEVNRALRLELAEKDPAVKAEAVFAGGEALVFQRQKVMNKQTTDRIVAMLHALPNGVQAMSSAMEGLVETSLNIGILTCKEGKLHVGISVRSSYESAKKALINRLKALATLANIEVEVTGDYPGWAYRKESLLRDKMVKLYEEMYGKMPEIQAIHAGLECGIFAHKIQNLDCVSIGPDMKNIHTTEEELSIASTQRVWEFLKKLLEEMK